MSCDDINGRLERIGSESGRYTGSAALQWADTLLGLDSAFHVGVGASQATGDDAPEAARSSWEPADFGAVLLMPTPPIAATEGLHRLQDCVSGLKVLRIRPGAALLVGTAVSGPCPGLPVVARLERGRPQQLLAPRLLAAAAGPAAGSPPHPNVVRTLGVHLVALPPEDADETYHSVTAHGDSGSIPGPSAAGTSPGAAGPSTLAHEAFSAPAGTAELGEMQLTGRLQHEQHQHHGPCHEDEHTAAAALRHAEVVRGAPAASRIRRGPAGTCSAISAATGLPSAALLRSTQHLSTQQSMLLSTTLSTWLRRALAAPPAQIREVVGALRGLRVLSGSEAARGERGGGMGGDMLSTLAVAAGDLLGVGGEECAEDVTLTLTELVDGGCLRDEAARGAFACVLPGAAPPPAPVLRGEAGEAQAQAQPGPGVLPAALRDASLLSRAERLLDTALDVACGLQHLHADMGLAHGDLVSRNVLLKRGTQGDGGQPYTAKLAGYGRLTAPPPPPEEPEPLPTAGSGGLSGNVAGGGGGAGAGSALRSSILCAGGSAPGTGSGYARVSATSVNRVNTVHVGLWRDVASLAPERLNDSTAPASHASDVYAYGVLLYEMAYGEQPWAGLTPASVVVGTATGELRLNCPQPLALPGISALLAACTSPSPELRPSVAALVDCVRGLREQLRAAKEAAAERQQQRQSNRLPGRDSTNA